MAKNKYYASVSFGKDSLAMLLLLIEREYPLDEVIFFDTGAEFKAIYNIRDKVKLLCKQRKIKFVELKPKWEFFYAMLKKPVKKRKTGEIQEGYWWCGGRARWGTMYKLSAIKKYVKDGIQYVGIAIDEKHRLPYPIPENKKYPLVEWKMTEADCLQYCYDKGYSWREGEVELYSILDRVSCWCCKNKNLKELKNIYIYARILEKAKRFAEENTNAL